jgi:hypothetical protein
MGDPHEQELLEEAAQMEWFDEQLRAQTREPVFAYLARYGDAIQERVDASAQEASDLRANGFPGAAVVRAAAAIEIAIRFFLVKPLVLGAFLSDEWAALLTSRVFGARGAADRELLPAILRNWGIDVTTILLADGRQMWETVVRGVWSWRNSYVHAASSPTDSQAATAGECLERILKDIVEPVSRTLGFTREETGRWCVVHSQFDRELNPPTRYITASPFDAGAT